MKLLLSGTEMAIRKLREAEAIAEEPPYLPGSLSALVQYRLGHLYLRRARAREEVEEAEECFRAATRDRTVAPWAFPYVLACLHRLREFSDASETLDRRIQETWARAASTVSHGPEREIDEGEPIPLQSATFNLLELATFFLDLPYEQLGRPEPSSGGSSRSGAMVVGPGLEPRGDEIPFAIAEDLVMAIAERTSGGVAFTLPPGTAKPRIRSASGAWSELGPGPARLLAFVLLGEAESPQALNRALAGCDAPEDENGDYDARRRKTLERARSRLGAVAGRPRDTVIAGDDGGLRLGDGIALYGAVDLRRLDDGQP